MLEHVTWHCCIKNVCLLYLFMKHCGKLACPLPILSCDLMNAWLLTLYYAKHAIYAPPVGLSSKQGYYWGKSDLSSSQDAYEKAIQVFGVHSYLLHLRMCVSC